MLKCSEARGLMLKREYLIEHYKGQGTEISHTREVEDVVEGRRGLD